MVPVLYTLFNESLPNLFRKLARHSASKAPVSHVRPADRSAGLLSGDTSRYAVEVVESAAARGMYAAMGATDRDLPVLVDQIIDATLRGHPAQGQGIEKLPKVWERFKGGTVLRRCNARHCR